LAASAAIVVGAIGAALAREPAGLLEGACVPSSHESQGVLLLNVALYLLAPLTVIVGGRALLRGPTAYRIAGGGSILAVAVPFVLLLANFGDYYCSH
jgi:hydrogenase-4 membrane subunit HyfE